VDKWVGEDNPERGRLRSLIDRGMQLHLEPGFSPNGKRGGPPLSATYKRMHTAVEKAFYEGFWEKGLAIILDKKKAVEDIDRFSMCRGNWALKQETIGGRPITDPSMREKDFLIELNSKFSKEAVDKEMGVINHPTLDMLMAMIGKFFNEGVEKGARAPDGRLASWEDVCIWKMDFKGAFTLLNFCTEATRAMAIEIWDGLVMIFLCGIFGWTGTPMCFQVITRTVLFELGREGVLRGLLSMFSDDLMGVCWRWDLEHDMDVSREFCWGLMGDNSTKASKDVWGRKLDFIGYSVDLDLWRVGISERNIYRAVYGFMGVDLEKEVTVRLMQRLASWGTRYAGICRYLLPMVRVLYKEYKGHHVASRWKLSEEAKLAVRMFQTMLMALGGNSVEYARDIRTFWGGRKVRVKGEFDASLSGIGMIWYEIDDLSGRETPVGYASQSLESLGFGSDSMYQNTAEYIGALLTIVGAMKLGVMGRGLGLRGDSMSALQWVNKGKARSELAMPAAFAHAGLLRKGGHDIQGEEFLEGELNWRADGLSRGKDIKWVIEKDGRFKGVKEVVVDWGKWVAVCDPKQDMKSEEGFLLFWGVLNGLINEFCVGLQ
jgi:hypothetical protein